MLLGCFRSGEAADPEVYTTAIIAVLAQYPTDIIRAISDPRTGLPALSKWLPTVSEVRAACESFAEADRTRVMRAAALARQIADRKADEASAEARKCRPTLAELKTKYGPNWGITGGRDAKPDPSGPLVADFVKRKYGITDEQWNAIPDFKA